MGRKNYVLAIIKDPAKLSERCDEINVFENNAQVRKIISDLKDTLKANSDLVALAAPQLGYKVRIFCIKFADENIQAFVNPMTTKIEGKCLMIEHIAGVDGEFMIQRPQRVMAGYQMAGGQYNELSLKHPLAAIFDQMLDILDGTLFYKYDILSLPIDKDYYKASKEEKEELHNWYFSTFLPSRLSFVESLAENDEEVSKIRKNIEYYKSIIEGKTEVVAAQGDKLDFETSSKKVAEEEAESRKQYIDSLKDKFGVK